MVTVNIGEMEKGGCCHYPGCTEIAEITGEGNNFDDWESEVEGIG